MGKVHKNRKINDQCLVQNSEGRLAIYMKIFYFQIQERLLIMKIVMIAIKEHDTLKVRVIPLTFQKKK